VLQAITQPKEGRQPRLQLTQEGQIINLDTKEVYNVPGFKKTPKATGGDKEEKPDVTQARVRAGMNEMLLADRALQAFETRFAKGEIKITVPQRVLQKLASDFKNEKEPLDKVLNSVAYNQLAKTNPELVEYMRNVDSFAEGETMITTRTSDYRAKMAQFLSGVAAGSPPAVVTRVQQRRRGILSALVKEYYKGDFKRAYEEAEGELNTGVDAGVEVTKQEWGARWMTSNPRRANESDNDYAARMTAAYRATGGK
jgi:hypothetical protein